MRSIIILWLILAGIALHAQDVPFRLSLDPVLISGLSGVQSFVYGHHDGKYLILGGRLDGLHRRQPPVAFDIPGHNTSLLVLDPAAGSFWTAPLSVLSSSHQEQLSSTNMAFQQIGETLYTVGGYGYSFAEGDHTTYPYLMAIEVPAVIAAVINGEMYADYFTQYYDSCFAVTGGHMDVIGDTLFLVGGQQFEGRYNPQGPTHGPGFFQAYTNAIRRFVVQKSGNTLEIQFLPEIVDSVYLHRRDFNVVPQIFPGGKQGLTAFSGVFQVDTDLPFLDAVNIDAEGYEPALDFEQYFNHYHCAIIPIYSAASGEMHNVFFGGIAQFYMDNGVLVQDDQVPFVKSIARVSRDQEGKMTEHLLDIEMPGYFGSGSEFLPALNIPRFTNGVIDMDALEKGDSILLGYVFGGIQSSARNIFFINNGTQSEATATLFKVYLHPQTSSWLNPGAIRGSADMQVRLFPNPAKEEIKVQFVLTDFESHVQISLLDSQGRTKVSRKLKDMAEGVHTVSVQLALPPAAGMYVIQVQTGNATVAQQIMFKP